MINKENFKQCLDYAKEQYEKDNLFNKEISSYIEGAKINNENHFGLLCFILNSTFTKHTHVLLGDFLMRGLTIDQYYDKLECHDPKVTLSERNFNKAIDIAEEIANFENNFKYFITKHFICDNIDTCYDFTDIKIAIFGLLNFEFNDKKDLLYDYVNKANYGKNLFVTKEKIAIQRQGFYDTLIKNY